MRSFTHTSTHTRVVCIHTYIHGGVPTANFKEDDGIPFLFKQILTIIMALFERSHLMENKHIQSHISATAKVQ